MSMTALGPIQRRHSGRRASMALDAGDGVSPIRTAGPPVVDVDPAPIAGVGPGEAALAVTCEVVTSRHSVDVLLSVAEV